ncbi:kinesin light chain 1, partial [Xylogone sp. PMI_703]
RLLKRLPNGDLELVLFNDDNPPPYAILSHTWTEGQEVTYNELVSGTGKDKTGYDKIRFCVDRAAEDGLQYSWVDTCCIDKSTNHELNTAINSMFRWYQRASKCYVYLSDILVSAKVTDAQAFRITWVEAFRRSRWFTRGWTLQELLAPPTVEFFSKNGKLLGNKILLEQEINQITRIPIEVLRGQSLSTFSIEERMSWAAERTTTLKEDKIYCLLGIFGVFLPLIYGEGEEYATGRLRDEIQKRQEGRGTERPQDLTGIVSLSLPFPRNELFVGREDKLQILDQFLLPNGHRRMTIYGLGGCGKSALALEFAYRALTQHNKHLVFWVPAISQESFELAYHEIGIRLRIQGITDDNADVKRLVKDVLGSDSANPWLMIVDNADDPGVLMKSTGGNPGSGQLRDYLPSGPQGKILFTTQSRKVAGDLTPSNMLKLNDMSEAEAQQLLKQRISNSALLYDKEVVNELLKMLAYLPLAIVQAAAFMNNNDISVFEYISMFRNPGAEAELFGEHFEDSSRYREMESTIAKTWHISFDQIRKQDPLAAEYLSFMACIDRINIPQSLLPPGGSLIRRAKAVGTLKGYAFITEHQQGVQELESEKFFDMHRLVHMASEWWLDRHGELPSWTAKAATRLEELIPYGGHERKEAWTTYLPHAIHVARLDKKLDEIARASLLYRIGLCQASLGQYSTAEKTLRQALLLQERRLGKEHHHTIITMNQVGIALWYQGKSQAAEMMQRQTLTLSEKVLGPEHQETLTSMGVLALVLSGQGKYGETESMHRQTLAQCEKVLGPEHPNTLASMSILARVLNHQGKYEEAELIQRQELAQCEKVLGLEHPNTLTSMSILARVLNNQGKYEEAESMNRQTLARREEVLGLEHPETLMSVYNLAYLLADWQRYEESATLYKRACAGYSTVLGRDHPTTLACHEHYSGMLTSQEREGLARPEIPNQSMELDEGSRPSSISARRGNKRLKLSN